jgi:hypothetical protein
LEQVVCPPAILIVFRRDSLYFFKAGAFKFALGLLDIGGGYAGCRF